MAKPKIVTAMDKIGETATGGYKKVEESTIHTYKEIEKGAVNAYNKNERSNITMILSEVEFNKLNTVDILCRMTL